MPFCGDHRVKGISPFHNSYSIAEACRAETTIALSVTRPVGATIFSFDLQLKTASESSSIIFMRVWYLALWFIHIEVQFSLFYKSFTY
jgi:hypothetical protein